MSLISLGWICSEGESLCFYQWVSTANICFCVKDAYLLSVDRKGFDVLGKVLGPGRADGSREYEWKEFRIIFKEEARHIETFCRQLAQMEEEALKNISSFSGLWAKEFLRPRRIVRWTQPMLSWYDGQSREAWIVAVDTLQEVSYTKCEHRRLWTMEAKKAKIYLYLLFIYFFVNWHLSILRIDLLLL